jgi:hypothetical protein
MTGYYSSWAFLYYRLELSLQGIFNHHIYSEEAVHLCLLQCPLTAYTHNPLTVLYVKKIILPCAIWFFFLSLKNYCREHQLFINNIHLLVVHFGSYYLPNFFLVFRLCFTISLIHTHTHIFIIYAISYMYIHISYMYIYICELIHNELKWGWKGNEGSGWICITQIFF